MTERVTLATSTGLTFLALAFHFGTGLIAIVAGFLGLAVRKGGQWHRRSGLVFVYSMIATGITAFGIAIYEGRLSNSGGILIVYLVFTAYTAVRPVPAAGRGVQIGLMVVALAFSSAMFARGFTALDHPGNQIEGVPAGMMFFLATVTMLAAIGDARMIRAGGIQGTRRLARHLWRMSFSLFIASGSFFLGQMKFVPERIRSVPLLFVLALSPLALLLYWMWRVRLRQNLRGMMTAKPIETRQVPEGERLTA